MYPEFMRSLSHHFVLHSDMIEQQATSWAEWRYHDNPDFCQMLCMGGELYLMKTALARALFS